MARNGNSVLRALRVEILDVTQQEMADATGLSSVYLSQVEQGHHDLGRDGALKVLDAYREPMLRHGLTLEDLLRGQRGQAA
jgi:transcriptional regulator with XRE-family HTH domain